jgi:hypothetical protein
MDFLSENQPQNHDEGLALFDKPVYSENFQTQSDVIIQPISPPGDSQHSSYTFIIGSRDNSLDNEVLAPAPNFPECVFENIAVSLNGVAINDHRRCQQFKSFINKNLGVDKGTKGSSLLANYWSDDMLESDIKVKAGELSKGFKDRSTLIEKSRDIFFVFAPMIDILTTERYLPPRNHLKIELERSSPNMCLLSPDQNLSPKYKSWKLICQHADLPLTTKFVYNMKKDF